MPPPPPPPPPLNTPLARLLDQPPAVCASLLTCRSVWPSYVQALQSLDTFCLLNCPCPACRRNAAAFTAGWEEGLAPEQQAAEAAASGPPAPSPAMLLAADSLQQLLRALAQHLDAVTFRCGL